jgi:hypothetical protein
MPAWCGGTALWQPSGRKLYYLPSWSWQWVRELLDAPICKEINSVTWKIGTWQLLQIVKLATFCNCVIFISRESLHFVILQYSSAMSPWVQCLCNHANKKDRCLKHKYSDIDRLWMCYFRFATCLFYGCTVVLWRWLWTDLRYSSCLRWSAG